MLYCQWLLQKLIEEASVDSVDVSEILCILSNYTVDPKKSVLRQLARLWDTFDSKSELKQFILTYTCLWDKDDSPDEIIRLLNDAARKLLMKMFLDFCEKSIS